ncbi:MAG: type II toxin-antitoxin system HicB family antitoxin [Planctomycetes bacterium]|nr:type II toxin-antitoxin system HicB family antitoxin [Planctomycetota bacterium]
MKKQEYVVIYEWAGSNYSAYVPDLAGCVACGDTVKEAERAMRTAIALYVEALKEEGRPVPPAKTRVGSLAVSA